jgi:transposase
MTTLAETVDAVIGIDTHRDSHEVEIVDPAGTPVMTMRIGNDSAGFTRLLAAIAEVVPGPRVAVCIEGSRSYGIGLARALAAAGLLVLECEQPSRKQRRGKGKSDPIDAHLAVLAALRLDAGRLPVPRADGDREALRILLVARQEITVACTAQTSRLRALLLAGDDTGRRAARTTLSGTSPIPASSGMTVRHRLNRGGDRQLNRALHTVIITRTRHHQPTRDYITRRQADGRTPKEIRRCLKRYLARHLYRELNRLDTT